MSGEKPKDGVLKYTLGILICTLLRLLPRLPNMEPIMATSMAYSKGYGWLKGAVFSMAAIVGYDLVTGTQGMWTLVTAPTYGLVAAGAYLYLRDKPNKTRHYLAYSIAATLFYDIVTGIGMGYIVFKMPLMMVVYGQIPFTLMHLSSSMLTALFAPSIYKWIVTNPDVSLEKIISRHVNITG